MAARSETVGRLLETPALSIARLVGYGLTLWALWSEVRPGVHGVHLFAWLVMASVTPGWFAWNNLPGRYRWGNHLILGWMVMVGGVLAIYVGAGYIFAGVGALGLSMVTDLPVAISICALGPAAGAIAVGVSGRPSEPLISVATAALGGLMLGSGRRAGMEKARQQTLVSVERERAEIEHERAVVLDERNRLAREVHDVLAHTLGALTVQLEALSARADAAGDAPAYLTDGLERTRALAADGLVEARRAEQALRDDAQPLESQIRRLCDLHGATVELAGTVRPLSPEAGHALYRVAQESLTNAAKHAPAASKSVLLTYGDDGVTLSVENGPGTEPLPELAASGGGYGLDGIRERVLLLGGEVGAGPRHDDDGLAAGWLVTATVPQ
jgi:signal transduction histidine kinase